MDKLKLFQLLILLYSGLTFESANAQYVDVVNDTKTIATVMKNTATMEANWQLQKSLYNKTKNLQEKNAGYTVDMAVIAEVYRISMQNVNGFGSESKYYQYIGESAIDIATRLPNLISAVAHASLPGKAFVLTELHNLYGKSFQLVSDFINIATNAKVKSPLSSVGTSEHLNESKKGDGYNLLDRNDRLTIAITIHSDLQRLRYKIIYLEWMVRCASWGDLAFKLDPQSWATLMSGKIIAQNLISRWNRL